MSSSEIKWLDSLISFIEDDDGMEAWLKKFCAILLDTMQDILKKAGEEFIKLAKELVIEAAEKDISGAEKLEWVTGQLLELVANSGLNLVKNEINSIVNFIVTQFKKDGIIDA